MTETPEIPPSYVDEDIDRLRSMWLTSAKSVDNIERLYPGLHHQIERVIDRRLRVYAESELLIAALSLIAESGFRNTKTGRPLAGYQTLMRVIESLDQEVSGS